MITTINGHTENIITMGKEEITQYARIYDPRNKQVVNHIKESQFKKMWLLSSSVNLLSFRIRLRIFLSICTSVLPTR